MQVSDNLRGLVQIASARIVAQAGPASEHVLLGRQRECGNIRKALDEPVVVGNDRGHLGLLQHDFRYPDCIGIAAVLPRQVMTPVAFLPGNKFMCERNRHPRMLTGPEWISPVRPRACSGISHAGMGGAALARKKVISLLNADSVMERRTTRTAWPVRSLSASRCREVEKVLTLS